MQRLSHFVLLMLIGMAPRVYSAVTLQAHQENTLNYLLKHPEQKGLLLYHALGSGKTYLSLAYAEKFQDKKVVVLLPRFLKSNWVSQMQSFGVKDPKRYNLVSFEEAENLLTQDLSNTIVIMDEAHKLIAMVHHKNTNIAQTFSKLYFKIRSAYKILALSGTPIFSDASDIAFLGNLISGKDTFPFDRNKFRTEYQSIKPVTSLFRGYILESKLVGIVFPLTVTLLGIVTLVSAPMAIPIVAMAGGVAIPLTNELIPAGNVAFREFDANKMKDFATQYISYYEIQTENNNDYPSKEFQIRKVHYSDPQAHFFLDLADEDLSLDELKTLLSEDEKKYTDEYINFHSMDIQKSFLHDSTVGREIGNFALKDEKKNLVESPKFEEIYSIIRDQPGSVAVYSNYYTNGILKFAEFLDRKGLKNDYVILNPDLPVDEQIRLIELYNTGKKRIVLIHPEITEGISLKGTEQFHILEPIPNLALFQQVVGRAVRYKSHSHLPKDRQKVNIYSWQCHISYSKYFPIGAGTIRRQHWQKRYSEINPSMWTKGIIEVDTNYFRKEDTADSRIADSQDTLEKDMENFKVLLRQYSVEKAN